MEFIKKRISKVPATVRDDSYYDPHALTFTKASSHTANEKYMEESTANDSDGIYQSKRTSVVQRRQVIVSSTSHRMVESMSDHQLGDYGHRISIMNDHGNRIRDRSPSPYRVMPVRNEHTVRPYMDGVKSPLPRHSLDPLSLLRQCEGSNMAMQSTQDNRLIGTDPLDLVIEATLQKTMQTFQRMVEDERAELLRMFPQLANVRRTAMADQGPGTDVVTETRIQPDGSIIEVQTVRTRRLLQVHKSINIVNGVVQNTHARAVMEYQGPNGGYRLKLEEDAGRDTLPDVESENEEDDDDSDRLSMAPSELSDNVSVMALVPRHQSMMGKSPHGDLVPQLQVKPKRKTDKAWFAAQELVESERRYVDKLRLLDQVFRTRIENDAELAKTIGSDKMLGKFFSNIRTLYSFHNDHLLPQLESKLREWRQSQKICDVMRRQAPFLKIYGEYTSNYKKATKTYGDLKKSNKKFAAIIDEIEKTPDCDNLPLSNHLICPVQRVTRYHLLMTEYLKNLTDGHPDKTDTEHALELTKEAALHANQMMRQLDKYKNVIEVQELLGSQVHDLLTPSRELIKKGRLMKISARNGEHQTRFVFLFNDMLLVCSERRSMVMTAWSGKYKLRAIFEVDGMQVLDGDNLDVENTFYIRSGNKMVEFYTNESKEKFEWMELFWSVIQDHKKRMQTFRKPDEKKDPPAQEVPKHTAMPALSNPENCSNCSAVFNAFKKSYICKSCGAYLCKKCCQKKLKLHGSEKEQRVCLNCYETLKINSTIGTVNTDSIKNGVSTSKNGTIAPRKSTLPSCVNNQIIRKSILEVKPSDKCIWNGYLDLKTANRKSWDRRYFALQQDFVLYTFRTDKDVCAKTSLPITGCRVSWVDPRQDSALSSKDANAFKVEHIRRVYYLKANTPEDMAKCVAALELASQAQLPAFGA